MDNQNHSSPAMVGKAFLDAVVAGDADRLDALLAPDATWWVQGWGKLDRAALLAGLGNTIARSSGRSMNVLRSTEQDDRVAIEAEGSFTFAEGIYANSYLYVIVTDGAGRIVEGKEYLDTTVAARFYGTGD